MKLKKTIVVVSQFGTLLIGLAVGYRIGATDELILRSGNIYTERGISVAGDFTSIQEIHQYIEIEGIYISGKIVSITVDDVAEIAKIIKKTGEVDPILSIKVLSNSRVEVTTGVIRGELDGGGNIYDLKKKNQKWGVHDTGFIRSWVS